MLSSSLILLLLEVYLLCGCRLVSSVFRLCEVEKRAVEVKLGRLLSPEVGCTVMWFLRRWSLSYLLPIETYYSEVSWVACIHPISFVMKMVVIAGGHKCLSFCGDLCL